jgi:hypothetical protein
MPQTCESCNRRILRHSRTLTCKNCDCQWHITCLPDGSQIPNGQLNHIDWLCPTCINDIFPFNHLTENSDFYEAISELNTSQRIPFRQLEHQIFNVFELNDDESLVPIYDADPDLQYFNELSHLNSLNKCDYYLEDSFIKKCCIDDTDNDSLSIIHFNARSLPKNMNQWSVYLNSLKFKFNIIGVSETWLNNDNAHLYTFDGYIHYNLTRENRRGGGVSLFIAEDLKVLSRHDLNVMNHFMEAIFVEIPKECFQSKNNVIMAMIYRPPNTDLSSFNCKLAEILDTLKNEHKDIYLLGDFNINILESSSHVPTAEFIETIYSNSLFPLITKPTRLQGNSATLIDNIFYNNLTQSEMINGILYTDISDHFPVFSIDFLKKKSSTYTEYDQSKSRVYSNINIDKFKDKLQQIDWSSIISSTNGKAAFSQFYEKFCVLYDDSFPFAKNNRYCNRIKWLTVGLKKSIRIKNKLYLKYKKSKQNDDLILYKDYKKRLLQILRISERNHYHNLLEEHKNNVKKTWIVLKDIIGKKKSKCLQDKFNVGNNIITNKKQISEGFNDYFTNVGKSLEQNIAISDIDPIQYIHSSNPDSIFLSPVTETEVKNLLQHLKNTSCGLDGIHAKIIKKTFEFYIEPLKHVLNLSITQGVFPNEMKIARVIPLFKGGDSAKYSNYRPVSILPLFSKLLERLMYNRILEFINKHDILYKYQFGFREKHSSNMALMILLDNILKAIDDGNIVIGLFLDFRKAFDTVKHDILLNKLYKYGIRGTAYDWLKDYLNKRTQFVSYNNVDSKRSIITCGVPQGSILGPLLFLLYINDIVNVSPTLMPIIFADDTNLFIKGKTVNETIQLMNLEIKKIVQWLNANRLSLNVDKTHYLIFRSSKRRILEHDQMYINGQILECKDETKFLGIILDCKLSWSNHISKIKSKIAKGIGIFVKARKILPISSMITLYYSLIYPHMTYCIEVWGLAADIYILSLFRLQKKIIRIIKSVPTRTPSDPLFKELGILKLNQIYMHKIILFMYNFIKNFLPSIFNDMFKRNRNIVTTSTRQTHDLHVTTCRTEFFMKSIRFKGPKIWNEFSKKIDHFCCYYTFKKRVKHMLLNT